MEFECKEIRISDEELGCTVTFSDTEDKGYIENQSTAEIIDSNEKYLLLQRKFPENEFEKDNSCYIESSNFETSGHFTDFKILLSGNEINVNWENHKVRIRLKINADEFRELISAIQIITNRTGNFEIKE